MRASILAFVLFTVAAGPARAADGPAPDPVVVAAERARKQAEAETAQLEAEKKKYEMQQAAAEARFGFLPKSPAEGKTTIDSTGAALETELLVADALATAAKKIATDIDRADQKILVLGGSESGGSGRLIAFQAEAYGLRNASRRALGSAELCPPSPVVPSPEQEGAVNIVGGVLPAMGALVGGLSDMLKTDTAVSGKTSLLGEEQLVRAIVASQPTKFRTAYLDVSKLDEGNSVIAELECLGRYRDEITAKLASFDTDAKKKANAPQIAQLAAQAIAHDSLFGRLTKVEKDAPPLLALLYADAEISKSTGSVLRVWMDASGGTIINRRNLWTNFGARAVSMTGGAVISYLHLDRSGNALKAGFLRCNTQLVSLRGVHRIGKSIGDCSAIKPSG